MVAGNQVFSGGFSCTFFPELKFVDLHWPNGCLTASSQLDPGPRVPAGVPGCSGTAGEAQAFVARYVLHPLCELRV